ncbi:P-loop containing nucleoside triphosphate hydrolase protein [Pseudovirgaria hyperparasitica]|uniref:Ribosome-releasing factor 2, mitochondrial n=1 Tax=Pseudovirgaria hyperparasitica TaxID=470096 RepID=A0A6A6WMP1_9PEZI|nr:P-loop containing nucleoside triphosphate hydrolase protein [Pseudovirgaria hyperparasitica]KAF2763396.1 P-loop containing nucleoside triphosphate hydrolase protein [Pseudovirgaria hyperparasitica]
MDRSTLIEPGDESDAGKTTTTERMLYYSGYTRRLGDVDEGSTVTDFLPAERARGITIQSAAISFHWPPLPSGVTSNSKHSSLNPGTPKSSVPHNINLIDTPGHADFTFEVLRSLRILDGAVCILDGVAGVEAQTEKVWIQADTYQIPRLIFVNKLDREGAAFGKTVKEIAMRLQTWPAVCQIPIWEHGNGSLQGVADVIRMQGLVWEKGSDGRSVKLLPLSEMTQELAEELKHARVALIELLSEYDEGMVEKYLDHEEDHLAIPATDVVASLRRCVLQSPQRVVPVYCGASFRNVGVQPLLDAVVDLLPAPTERPDAEVNLSGKRTALEHVMSGTTELTESPKKKKTGGTGLPIARNLKCCALAFKVVNDAKRGALVYVRVYSGALERGTNIYNTNLNVIEKAHKLLRMYANDAVELESIEAGQIGVIPGLKFARTGDTLISYSGMNSKSGPPAPLNSLQLRPITVPPPVFFSSVEPQSLSEGKNLSEQLAVLLREDPSLNVSEDPESGQTHLAGMGELHLEIASGRLINDMKVKASVGSIEIGYRETIPELSESYTEHLNREFGGTISKAVCDVRVRHLDISDTDLTVDGITVIDAEAYRLVVRHPTLDVDGEPIHKSHPRLPEHISLGGLINSLQTGVKAGLARGPKFHYPVHSVEIVVDIDPAQHIFPDTTLSAVSTAAFRAVKNALRQSNAVENTIIMEPVMNVTITMNESDMGSVIQDISSARGGQVLSLEGESAASTPRDYLPILDVNKVYAPPDPFGSSFGSGIGVLDAQRQITARVPLKEMVGYLKRLRSLTGGRGTFVMSVDRFERMSTHRQKAVLNEMRGA